jgi:predicted RecA/RadA family phage recombinase
MPPRPDGRLEPGQPLRGAISARAWNRAQDAADLVLGAHSGTEGGSPGSPVLKPYTWAYCQPSVTVARWGVLAITGVAITPTGSSGGATASFEEMPVLTGGTPSATTTAWCVAVEPIESGKIGRVAVGGVVQLKAADLGKASGAHVLWKDSNWALIRIGGGIVYGTFGGTWAVGSTKTVTDELTGTQYTAKNNSKQFDAASFSGAGTPCVIAAKDGEWVLVAVPTKVTVISSVAIVGTNLRFATSQVNVIGSAFGNASIDIPLESC